MSGFGKTAAEILRSFAPASGTVEEGIEVLREAMRAADEDPDAPASRLVRELARAVGVEEASLKERLGRSIAALWGVVAAGGDIVPVLRRTTKLAEGAADLPEAILILEMAEAVDLIAEDIGRGGNPREILRKALEAAIPGVSGLIDHGWSISDGIYRPAVPEGARIQIRPGVWATQPRTPAASFVPIRPVGPNRPARKRGIYMASKATAHGPTWQRLRDEGWPIISTWIDESAPGLTLDWPDLWERCLSEVTSAEVCIVYMEPGEVLKGAWVEVGAALTAGVPVIGVGISDFSILKSGKIIEAQSLSDALDIARGILVGNMQLEPEPVC